MGSVEDVVFSNADHWNDVVSVCEKGSACHSAVVERHYPHVSIYIFYSLHMCSSVLSSLGSDPSHQMIDVVPDRYSTCLGITSFVCNDYIKKLLFLVFFKGT